MRPLADCRLNCIVALIEFARNLPRRAKREGRMRMRVIPYGVPACNDLLRHSRLSLYAAANQEKRGAYLVTVEKIEQRRCDAGIRTIVERESEGRRVAGRSQRAAE